MLCLGGLGLCFWMSVEVSCPARRQSNHYLTAEAPPCCCEVRPVAAGSCSSAAVSAMGYALRRSLSVVAGCLGNGRLCQQWACISVGVIASATAGCISSGHVSQSGQVASVIVDAPPPWSISGTVSMASIWNCCFVCPTVLSQALCPCNPLGWPTAQAPFSLEFSPLKSQVAVSTGHPYKRALWGSLGRAGCRHPSCRLLQAEPLPGVPRLLYTWEFPHSVGHKD